MRSNRGFSMVLVLLALIVLSIIGVTTLTISTTEAGVAEARVVQRQALAAADAGLNHFLAHQPASFTQNTYYVGSASSFIDLPGTTDARGRPLQARYRVRTTTPVPGHAGLYVLSEGQVVSGDHVIGSSLLSAIVNAIPGTGSNVAGQGQKSLGAWGTSSNLPPRTDVSLVFEDEEVTP